jgi:putative phosphoribosyl transferase
MIIYEEQPLYRDRQDAGRQLAETLAGYTGSSALVLAIPRGGVPVAVEVAERLGSTLDVIVTRKIPIPFNPEAGYGAVADDGTIVLNEPLVRSLGLSQMQIQRQADEVKAEIDRRVALYRSGLPFPPLKDKTAIVVDDGLASGFTMIAAIESARRRSAGRVVVAVPIASDSAFHRVGSLADEIVCPVIARTEWFAVASFYHHWYDLSDNEVVSLLQAWRRQHALAEPIQRSTSSGDNPS